MILNILAIPVITFFIVAFYGLLKAGAYNEEYQKEKLEKAKRKKKR